MLRPEDLLERFLAGDAVAIAEVRLVATRVVSFHKYSIPPDAQGDLIQESLAEVLRATMKPGFKLHKDFLGLVARIAMSRCVDWIRRDKRMRVIRLPERAEYSDGPFEALAAKEDEELRSRILRALPDGCRELIRLRLSVEQGLTLKQIADQQGRSHDAVRQAWCKCLKKAGELRMEFQKSVGGHR